MKIHILTTGGTIDKVYFDAMSEYQIGEPVIGDLLHNFGTSLDYQLEPLMRKDSLELDDADRALIRDRVASCDCSRVLITHGTDTMVDTAKCLQGLSDKCIVLTGALQPAAFHDTDAVFNIGCALGALQSKPNGVYVVMSGRVFDADKVAKNRVENRFEARVD